MKTWNVRDQTTDNLQKMVMKKYKDIENSFKLLKKLAKIEDAKKMIDEIWSMKRICEEIEIELMRRSWKNGTQNENEQE